MKISELFEKVDPKELTFKYIDDSEGDRNRGWIVDKIEAFLNGQEVGYLKLSYIPLERFDRYYPDLINFLSRVGGHDTLPYEEWGTPWQDIPASSLRKNIFSIAQTARLPYNECNRLSDEAEVASDAEVYALVGQLAKQLEKEYGWQFRRFRKYYVNKPIVDFIRVHEGYKRQGIGTALYRAGYEWMKSKGMRLYASSAQSDDAKAAWRKLVRRFPIARERPMNPFAHSKRVRRKYFA